MVLSYQDQIDNARVQVFLRWRRFMSTGDESSFLSEVEPDVEDQMVRYSLKIRQGLTGFRLSGRFVIVDLLQLCINSVLPSGIAVGAIDNHCMTSILQNQLTEFILWSVGGGCMYLPSVLVVSQFNTLRPSKFGILL
jgi:hypothetical protein